MKTLNQYITESYRNSAAEDFLDDLSDVVVHSSANPFHKYHFSRAGWSYVPYGETKYPAIFWEHDSDDKAVIVMVTNIDTREIHIIYTEHYDQNYRNFTTKDSIVWNVPEKGWHRQYIAKLAKLLRENN